jgi:hypothetical protein
MFKTSKISYGGTAAVVTSMALVSGLSAAGASKAVIASSLLIAAFADNLTDALSFHIFQESEQLDQKNAFIRTITNFVTRLLLCISFVLLIGLFSLENASIVAIAWGIVLLVMMTYLVARERKVKPVPEVAKHLLVASVVVLASNMTGYWVGSVFR